MLGMLSPGVYRNMGSVTQVNGLCETRRMRPYDMRFGLVGPQLPRTFIVGFWIERHPSERLSISSVPVINR
jgi:hypothetical protein